MGMATLIRKMITVQKLEVIAIWLLSLSFVIYCTGVLLNLFI